MRGLVPVPQGEAYRLDSPPWNAMVRPPLAAALAATLERFAREAGFTPARPVEVHFEPGVAGHHRVGRAADIYQVARIRLDEWKRRWDLDEARAGRAPEAAAAAIRRGARHRNLGWRLYKALQRYGRWARPPGHPVQLFGPWTRDEGPWRPISDRLLHAHRDHIHVAL